MNILIVEDITLVAERIAGLVQEYYQPKKVNITHAYDLDQAALLLREMRIDLLLLDLNLNGKDGFELLNTPTSQTFRTIVITANEKEAARAFDLGIFDFIRKPITLQRLKLAMQRLEQGEKTPTCIPIRTVTGIRLLPIGEINYAQAAKNYTQIFLLSGESILFDRSIQDLANRLPGNFRRVHRSFLIALDNLAHLVNLGGGKYTAKLRNGARVPINRTTWLELSRAPEHS